MSVRVLGRIRSVLRVDRATDGLAIHVSHDEPAGSSTLAVEAYALTDDGRYFVGRASSLAPSTGAARARTIALASCPGAVAWEVEAVGSDADTNAELSASAGSCAGIVGCIPLDKDGRPAP